MLEQGPMRGEAMKEQCKPDYERAIAREREEVIKITNLINAIWEFVGRDVLRNKMAEMMGELVSMERSANCNIEELIQAQENDK